MRSVVLIAVALLVLTASFHSNGGGGEPSGEPSVFIEEPGVQSVLVHEASFEVNGRLSGSVTTIELSIDGAPVGSATRSDDGGWRFDASRVSVSPGLHRVIATAIGPDGSDEDGLWVHYEPDPDVGFRVALVPETATYEIPVSFEENPDLLLLGPSDDDSLRLDLTVDAPPQIDASTNAVLDTGSLASLSIFVAEEVPGVYPVVVRAESATGEVHEATHTVTVTGAAPTTTPPNAPTTATTTSVTTTDDVSAIVPARVLTDDFEGPDRWTATTTRSENGASGTVEVAAGGNPGGQRRMTHVLPGTADGENNPSQITVLHTFGGGGWDPSIDGPLARIDYREDQIEVDPPFDGAAIGATFVIMQDGTTYTASINENNAFSNLTWQTVRVSGLTAADFSPAPGPDFSATGAPLTFGYSRGNTSRSTSGITTQHGIDNWTVELFGE